MTETLIAQAHISIGIKNNGELVLSIKTKRWSNTPNFELGPANHAYIMRELSKLETMPRFASHITDDISVEALSDGVDMPADC